MAGMAFAAAIMMCCTGAASAASAASAAAGWTVQPVPLKVRSGETHGGLSAVTCATARNCDAVGQDVNRSGTTAQALVEHWDGSTWGARAAPGPAGAVDSGLAGVSCVNGVTCTAVGSYVEKAGTSLTLAENWNGDAWMVQPTPSPGGANDSELLAVSCVSAASCTAVGDDGGGSGASVTLAEHWNGSAWTTQPTPIPAGANDSQLLAVSCPSAASCTAVGHSGTSLLAEHWNGSTWTIQPVPSPGGANDSELLAVSCPSAASCTASGSYTTASGASAPLAERWNGSTWTIKPTPLPPGADGGVLSGVWCVSAASCTAVGWSAGIGTSGASFALAEYWNGKTWTVQATASPAGHKALEAVACTAQRACTAVGITPQAGAGAAMTHPLAEQE
jgi:hypothetical protein